MSATGQQNVKVTVFSDLACPWCYIGQRRLDKALEQMPGVKAEVEWHAFLLDWNAPLAGQPISEALQKKFGPQAPQLMQRVVGAGRADGVQFADWQWRANTVKGHVLVALARRHGKSHEANRLLFEKSYEAGANITDTGVLQEVGRQLGLPEAELQAALGGAELDPELLEEVEADDATAKSQLRVSGVPFFLISSGDSKAYALSGAQPPEAFQEAVQRALKDAGSSAAPAAAAGGAATAGDGACARDGTCL
ncbi:DSBA oxidoreductase [Micractinium conductrix]|uniref:DSBA oxidoreductase n=1 Tax=Micractinium conductrix TaxID=554055 RepID=A0A2P6VBU7_9CHLO|nr:DSBA oxidoreductase [Micractinium conductrix]|eukprot:PSC71556.1 DSBA oxidoreductase [Micractinium conductrix]